jgi:arylsulfatase A-like enzyme
MVALLRWLPAMDSVLLIRRPRGWLPVPLRFKVTPTIALALLLASCGGHGDARPPNVFLLLVDTLRADRVSCYEPGGMQSAPTPHLAAFAEQSTVFWNAYAQSSWTRPSVASLFTSRYPSQHRTTQFVGNLPMEEETLAEVFKDHGYATAGFSANILVGGAGYEQGFDSFKFVGPPDRDGAGKARAQQVDAAALAWLDGLPSGAAAPPVFLYLHYMEPHIPYEPSPSALQEIIDQGGNETERMRGVERARRMVSDFIAELEAEPADALNKRREPVDAQTLAGLQDLYDAEVASWDAGLAEFFRQLELRGFLSNALVVITSDHGEEFQEHGRLWHGETLYNEVLHVPLLVRLPQQTHRIDARDTVSLIDVTPTLLDYSGVPPPDRFEGRSLRGIIAQAHGWRRWLTTLRAFAGDSRSPRASFSELFPHFERQQGDAQLHRRSIIAGAHKLIVRADGSAEAYDLAADPKEQAATTLPAGTAGELRQSLRRFAARVATTNSPAYLVPPLDEATRERLHALGYTQ